jgi:hypothetical protein
VSPGAHPSSYNSVATTLYSTLVLSMEAVATDEKISYFMVEFSKFAFKII